MLTRFLSVLLSASLLLAITSARFASAEPSDDAPAPAAETAEPETVAAAPAAETAVADADASISARDEASATTHVASFAPTQLKDSPAVVTVISGEDIRASGARDLIDILYFVPGYFMGLDTEGVVGPGFRGLWGHEGKILLLIDGKEMNELLFSNMQLGNEFPVELIERVEVIRGPGSVIYGGLAELSVINVVTRGLQGSTDVMANATYGQMTDANNASTGYGQRKLTASGRFVVDSVPGLSSFVSLSLGQGQRSMRTFVDNSGNANTMEGNSALNPALVHAGIGYRNLQASFLYDHLGTSSISGIGMTRPQAVPVSFDSYQGELVATIRPNSRFEIVPRFNVTYQVPWNDPNQDGFLYNKSVRRLRGRLLGRWAPIDELQITVGGDAMFDHASVLGAISEFNTGFGQSMSPTIDYQTYGTYVELFSENPIVNIAAGARYDHLSTIGGSLVPRLVLLRNFGPVSLKGLFSESFRAPGVENINLGGNLHPEHTRIFEFEAGVDMTPQQRLSANVFDIRIDSPIAYSLDPTANVEQYRNLGQQGSRGFEATYRLRTNVARLEANYSFYKPTAAVDTPPYIIPGHPEQFLAAPAQHGSVRATFWPLTGLGISPSAVVLGTRYTRGAPDNTGAETAIAIPATVLANLFIYRDNVGVPGLTVGLGIYNIFGANYTFIHASAATTYAGDQAPMPGLDREVMLRLTYRFDPTADPARGSLALDGARTPH